MPIYEYTCKTCGDFEVTQRMSDTPLKRCPTCRGKVTKLISRSSFHLKGGGWYVTDYAKKNGTESKDSSDTDGKTDKPDTDGKTERPGTTEEKQTAPKKSPDSSSTKATSSKKAGAAAP